MIKRLAAVVLLVLAVAVCDTTPPPPAPRLKGPVALVNAGPLVEDRPRYIFIVGGERDVVYVMDVTGGSDGTGEFVRAPNKFFPLEIPVDQVPVDATATADGKYLLVVCAGSGTYGVRASVNVIDTTTFERLSIDGTPVRQEGELGIGPTSIIAAPTTVERPNRFYVALAGERAIVPIDLELAGGVPLLRTRAKLENTGAITRLIGDSSGTVLFGADASTPYVHRVSLSFTDDKTHASAAEIDVGGPSLDVALGVSDGKDVLFVARPDTMSVALFDPTSGAHLDANPIYAPRIPEGAIFEDIYLGSVPARLIMVHDELSVRCVQCNAGVINEESTRKLSAYIMVATDEGELMYIGTGADNRLDRQLINHRFCSDPDVLSTTTTGNSFTADQADGSADLPFLPCGPSARRRQACAVLIPADGSPRDSGVGVFLGNTPTATSWNLTWEAILPGLDRANGGGRLSDDGTVLSDANLDYTLLPIPVTAGDKVTLEASPAAADGACADTAATALSFTVAALVTDPSGRQGLQLDRAARRECYPNDVGYTVRVGGAFLLSGGTTNSIRSPRARLHLGETYGDNGEEIRFTLRADRTFTQDQFYEFIVNAPFERVLAGRALDSTGTALLSVGRLPSAMLLATFGAPGSDLARYGLAAFAGNDVLIRFVPNDTSLACGAVESRAILR